MGDYQSAYATYLGLTNAKMKNDREEELANHRAYLLADMEGSLDYHEDCLRNGEPQPFLLTRGGEANTYNVICRPGDELYAGDIIDAFGEKWIVMEARADATTHKTGIMHQCNHFMRWQNFTPKVCETWCFIRTSGYSAYINSDTQLQKSDEQEVIYLPWNEDTSRIYVDKRLPSHRGYNEHGEEILYALKVTGVNPISKSFNGGDHLLMLKIEADVEHKNGVKTDNLDLEICDYVEPEEEPEVSPCVACGAEEASNSGRDEEQPAAGGITALPVLYLSIAGKDSIRLGRTLTYQAGVTDTDGKDRSNDYTVEWVVAVADKVSYEIDGNTLKLKADKKAEVGAVVSIEAKFGGNAARKKVEVVGVV